MQKPEYFKISRDILEPLTCNILNNLYAKRIDKIEYKFRCSTKNEDAQEKIDVIGTVKDGPDKYHTARVQVKTIAKSTNVFWIKSEEELNNNNGYVYFEKPIDINWLNNSELAKKDLIGTKVYLVSTTYLKSIWKLFRYTGYQYLIDDNKYIAENKNIKEVYTHIIKESDF